MANTGDQERRDRSPNEPLRRSTEKGPVYGTDASERAANLADAEDAPLTAGDTTGGNPPVRTVPAVMPAGAMANMSGDGPSGAAGGTTGSGGSAAAAAVLAGEIAFAQDDVKTGWDVLGADDQMVGTVAEVGPERVLVSRSGGEGMIYIPYSGLASADKGKIHLTVSSELIERQDWQQVRTGGPSSGSSPPPKLSDRPAPPTSGVGVQRQSVGPTTRRVDTVEDAGPVTTGRGVEEGPTHQTIRVEDFAAPPPPPPPVPTPKTEAPRRLADRPISSQPEEGMGTMNKAQDMMHNLRNSVSGGSQGQMSQSAPKEAFADMFSFLENIPNTFYYLATVVAVMSSLVLFLTGKRWESLFVGLWAPTIVSASMFYKLLRPSHEVRRM